MGLWQHLTVFLVANRNMGSALKIGAVLLAAGSASRMGHRPKCLLELEGVPLIRRQLRALLDAGVDEVVVVLGHYADHIEAVIPDCSAKLIRNPHPDAGQISSLRFGLQSLTAQIDSAIVALADQPLISSQEIFDLIDAYKNRPNGSHFVQPDVAGLPGNPVMFSATVRDDILASGPDVGGRQWQSTHPSQVYRWASPNHRYRTDVDTQEDIDLLFTQTGLRLKWPESNGADLTIGH